VRGRRVNEPGSGIGRQRHRFARGIIGQAQDGNVGLAQEPASAPPDRAAARPASTSVDVCSALQPRYDLQAGCAVFAVNEDLGSHRASPFMQIKSGACAALRTSVPEALDSLRERLSS
jgi:hypothetical protein